MRPSNPVTVAGVTLLLLAMALSGCLDDGDEGGGSGSSQSIAAPKWQIGQWWQYGYFVPEATDSGFKLIVAANDGENYWLGTEDLRAAQYHAVLNFNPVLGRVRLNDFALYEGGQPQQLLAFPLTKDKSWSFSLLGYDFNARVVKVEKTTILGLGQTKAAHIEATGQGAEKLTYIYADKIGWLYSFNLSTPAGDPIVLIDWARSGGGYSGTVNFVRAKDLYNGTYQSTPANPEYKTDDTFIDEGHPTAGGFDDYITYLEYTTASESRGTVTLRDHEGNEPKTWSLQPDENQQLLNIIPINSGEWTVSIELEGTTYMRMRIAGGILYDWQL